MLIASAACSGYRVKGRENPLEIYGIKRLSLPLFINQSTLANVSSPFTREIADLLSRYKNLKVIAGETLDVDGVLIGIITSPKHLDETVTTTARTFTESQVEGAIGDRRDFYTPLSKNVLLKLNIILIKRPTEDELKLIKDGFYPHMSPHPKIVINETIEINASYDLATFDSSTPDSGGDVNFTHAHEREGRAILSMAQSARDQLKEIILDAF